MAVKSDSAENPGTICTLIVHLRDVMYEHPVTANPMSLWALHADVIDYVGNGGMISIFG